MDLREIIKKNCPMFLPNLIRGDTMVSEALLERIKQKREIEGHEGFIGQCSAEVIGDGNVKQSLVLPGETIPDRRHPPSYRSVSTTESIQLTNNLLQTHDCRIRKLSSFF
jgi:hypothetical protein